MALQLINKLPNRQYNVSSATTYNIELVAYYEKDCSDTVNRTFTVNETPNCSFSIQNQGYLNYKFTPANSGYVSYEWFFGDGNFSTNVSPSYKYGEIGAFNVQLVAKNQAGCSCSQSKWIFANTGVNSITDNAGLKIYPNPNNGEFTIARNGSDEMKVEIFDLIGNMILSRTTSENNINVNIKGEALGMYLIKVTINGNTTTTKVVVAE